MSVGREARKWAGFLASPVALKMLDQLGDVVADAFFHVKAGPARQHPGRTLAGAAGLITYPGGTQKGIRSNSRLGLRLSLYRKIVVQDFPQKVVAALRIVVPVRLKGRLGRPTVSHTL
jgi:hypothetical protein